MAKILVVEDNKDVCDQVVMLLTFEHHAVESLANGLEASSSLRIFEYDVFILDWDLPGMSGIQVCREYRQRGGKAPILMLTGKSGVDDKEAGLDSGADDYLTKPFHMKELAARVRALLRRPAPVQQDNVLRVGAIELDPAMHRIKKDGQMINLVPREFALLEFMMRHPNQVLSAEALLNRVWPTESDATTEAVRTAMKRMRKQVDPDQQLIKTVHGVGYVLESN